MVAPSSTEKLQREFVQMVKRVEAFVDLLPTVPWPVMMIVANGVEDSDELDKAEASRLLGQFIKDIQQQYYKFYEENRELLDKVKMGTDFETITKNKVGIAILEQLAQHITEAYNAQK